MSDVIRVSVSQLRYKLEDVSDVQTPVWPGEWDLERRLPLEASDKYRGIAQRYEDGRRWEDTDLFRNIYAVRFSRGETVRGCETLEMLAAQYYDRVDSTFESLLRDGFLERIDGVLTKLPEVFIGRDGEVIASNQGNHRLAMAKVLGLPSVLVRIRARHPLADTTGLVSVTRDPALHAGAESIPAMTTKAEQFACYQVARAQAPKGAIIELGVWLGAVTAYLAAGVRDAGGTSTVHAYDRFTWKPVHTIKAGGVLDRPMREQVEANLGPLLKHVELHEGDFRSATWDGSPISALVLDGPKRVTELTRTLPIFGPSVIPGATLVIQDFAHFPSYDLPAACHRLETVGVLKYQFGVYPGTMVLFEVRRRITAADVSMAQLALTDWTAKEIVEVWDRWAERLPPGQIPRFRCGAALFLCDRGYEEAGTKLFRQLLGQYRDQIAPKWQMLRDTDHKTIKQYPSLDAEVGPWSG